MSVGQKVSSLLLPVSDESIDNAIGNFEPDVVYSDSPLYGTQLKAYSCAHGMRLPLVLHLRGDWWREYWDWFYSATQRQRLLSSQRYVYHWLSVLLASRVTPICRWLEQIVKHYVPGKRTEVVYQGVDPNEFRPEGGLNFQRPAVAIIQNHTVYAKVQGLLNFSRVIERLPETHFYIAEGENVKQNFLSLVKERLSPLPNVHFVEGINNPQEVRRMLTAADCFVLASGLDCCPTSVLEASLMGKPVIASRVGGVPEIVKQGQTGWSIDNGRVEDWVEKIRLVTTDGALNRRLGGEGRKWVAQTFSWRIISKQVESMLEGYTMTQS